MAPRRKCTAQREGQSPLGQKKRKATDHVGVEMRDDVVRDSVGGPLRWSFLAIYSC